MKYDEVCGCCLIKYEKVNTLARHCKSLCRLGLWWRGAFILTLISSIRHISIEPVKEKQRRIHSSPAFRKHVYHLVSFVSAPLSPLLFPQTFMSQSKYLKGRINWSQSPCFVSVRVIFTPFALTLLRPVAATAPLFWWTEIKIQTTDGLHLSCETGTEYS